MKETTNRDGHTPGPWHVECPYGEPGTYIGSPSTALIAKVYNPRTREAGDSEELEKEDTANARLIAQAPAMLAFIREWRAVFADGIADGGNDEWPRQFDAEAAAILARVDGERGAS